MTVTVDDESFPTRELGLSTVGQVLGNLRQCNRFVTRLVIDGEAPDLGQIQTIQALPLEGHVVFIETADPNEMATQALQQAEDQLDHADAAASKAAELLRGNQWTEAMAAIGQCINIWQETRKTVIGVSRLRHFDLQKLSGFMSDFAQQLRQIQATIQSADVVGLTDLMEYESPRINEQWRQTLHALGDQPVQSAE